MSAQLDREQLLLDRLSLEIPAFKGRIASGLVTMAELEEHRQLVIDALGLVDQGSAPYLAGMRDQLALYGLELVHLQLQVQQDHRRVSQILS